MMIWTRGKEITFTFTLQHPVASVRETIVASKHCIVRRMGVHATRDLVRIQKK